MRLVCTPGCKREDRGRKARENIVLKEKKNVFKEIHFFQIHIIKI